MWNVLSVTTLSPYNLVRIMEAPGRSFARRPDDGECHYELLKRNCAAAN